MKHCPIAAGAVALALCGPAAHADEFDFIFTGSGIARITDPTPCTRDNCDPNVGTGWNGSLKLILDDAGDGTYTDAGIRSLAVQSNWQSYTWSNGDAGLLDTPSVTVQGGVVTDLEFNWTIDETHQEVLFVTTYPGSGIGAFANAACSGCGRYDSTGYAVWAFLTPIPEPAQAALLLAGLGLLAARSRRNRR